MLLLRLMPAAAASRLDRLNKVDNTKAKERENRSYSNFGGEIECA